MEIYMKLLLVEDDTDLGKVLKRQMEAHGITVYLCTTGKQCTELIYSGFDIDIIVLDWMLPDKSGLDILNQLYFDKISIPIIMLTALGTLENKTAAFSLGADDYIVKPFEFDELLARINALYRRSHQIHSFDYSYGDINYLIDSRTIQCDGRSVQLTNRESQLFELLLRSAGKLVSHDEIIEAIWGLNSNVGNGNILNYVYFLRNRLKTVHSRITIKGVYGSGYTLVYEKEESPK
jgi:DNA-binding response OmpR family regulator